MTMINSADHGASHQTLPLNKLTSLRLWGGLRGAGLVLTVTEARNDAKHRKPRKDNYTPRLARKTLPHRNLLRILPFNSLICSLITL